MPVKKTVIKKHKVMMDGKELWVFIIIVRMTGGMEIIKVNPIHANDEISRVQRDIHLQKLCFKVESYTVQNCLAVKLLINLD